MSNLEEWSTNFDTEDVAPFLHRIAPHIEMGFGQSEIDSVVQLIEGMEVDDESGLVFKIRHAGKPSDFKIGVFLDDISASDLYFSAPPALIKQISSEMRKFCEERGM